MDRELIIFSDGGSRGNPGPAAAAFVIKNRLGQTVAESSRFLGVTTNNVAEYQALIAALAAGLELGAKRATCFLDSELVVKQLNREYRIKEAKMRQLFAEIEKIIKKFERVSFTHVPRHQNKRADQLVNQTLDGRL